MHTNTHTPRPCRQSGSACTAGPTPNRGPCSHQEGPEVTREKRGRPRPEALGRGDWLESGGAFPKGPKSHRRSAGASRIGCFSPASQTHGLRPRGRCPAEPRQYRTRRAELLPKTVGSFAPSGLTLRVGPECCEARPGQAEEERAELPGGRAGFPRGVGRAPLPPVGWRPAEKRAARAGGADSAPRGALRFAAAGPQPGLREPHSRGCAAAPTCTPLGPVGLPADGAGAGARRAHGWPRGAAAGGSAGSGSTRLAVRTRRRRAGRAEPGARPETERKRK